MTVGELIEKLNNYDKDLPVLTYNDFIGMGELVTVVSWEAGYSKKDNDGKEYIPKGVVLNFLKTFKY